MSFAYTEFLYQKDLGNIDPLTANWRVLLCMTNATVTAPGQEDVTTLSGLTLDEHNGAGYSRQTVTGAAVTKSNAGNRSIFTFNPVVFTGLHPGTRQMKGYLLYIFDTDDAHSLPCIFVDSGGFPLDPALPSFVITPAATGVATLS